MGAIIAVTSMPLHLMGGQGKKERRDYSSSECSSSSSESLSNDDTFDYVIVGCGTAGSALAAKLSDPDKKGRYRNSVLVLESGENESNSQLVLVNNVFAAAAAAPNPTISSFYSTFTLGDQSPDGETGFLSFMYLEGKMWGGSSGHNYFEAVRGTPSIYDQWAAISGDARWSYNNLLNNVMIPLEHYTPNGTIPNTTQRGFNGPLFISQAPPINGDAFAQAVSIATDTPIIDDYNISTGVVGICALQNFVTPPVGGPNSHRSFAASAFLTGDPSVGVHPIVDANGKGLKGRKLKIVSNAHANKVLFTKKNIASGVEYVLANDREKVFVAKAKKKVILCSGAISDPAILQRSGIGDAALLNDFGIPVVFANSNVGEGLMNQAGTHALIDATTTIQPPLFFNGYIGFAPNTSIREYQIHFIADLGLFPRGIAGALNAPATAIDILGANMIPRSRGSVKIVTRDPLVQPLVNFNLFTDGSPFDPGSDANQVVNFYNTIQAIAEQAGGTVIYPTAQQYLEGPGALFGAGVNTLEVYDHATGTCAMGRSAANGVVDGKLHVFGVKNLMVASNAAVPVIEDGNTSSQAYYIGLEAARIILKQ